VLAAIDAWTGVETEPPEALPSAPRREPGLPVGARLERMAALADADETALVSWILEALGWDVGVLWVRDDHEPLLRCSTVVCAPGIEAHELTRQSRAVTYRPGVGIPGGVWRRGAPVWNEDLRGTNRMPRARAAHAAGLRGALHLPLRDEHGTVSAVLELHSRAVQPRDRGLLEELTAAGDGPLGRAFAAAHRRGRAAADARVSAAVAHARALLDGRAAAPARRALCQAVLELTGTDLVLLFEPWEDQLQATASAGGEIGLPALQLEGQGVSATVGAYRSGRAAYVGDLRSGAAASAHLAAAWNLRAGFFQPVLGTDGRSLGVIVAAWREGGRRPSTAVRRVIDELLRHAAPLLERT
jgi:hypothetical protein